MLFEASQTSVLSLLSSTSSDPLQLFQICIPASDKGGSCIISLHDAAAVPPESLSVNSSLIKPPPIRGYNEKEATEDYYEGYSLDQAVVHIQSPLLQSTFIQCPRIALHKLYELPSSGIRNPTHDLGIKLPWMHVQVRNMGARSRVGRPVWSDGCSSNVNFSGNPSICFDQIDRKSFKFKLPPLGVQEALESYYILQ
jgi:hypothetical protein